MIKYQIFSNSQNRLQKPCIATIGKFDGVHAGHQKLLKLLKTNSENNNLIPTVITFDPHPRGYFDKNFQNLQTLNEKIQSILELGIEQVVVLEFNEFLENLSANEFFEQIIINELDTKLLIVGEDFAFGKDKNCNTLCLQKLCSENSLELKVITKLKVNGKIISSSSIRDTKFKK